MNNTARLQGCAVRDEILVMAEAVDALAARADAPRFGPERDGEGQERRGAAALPCAPRLSRPRFRCCSPSSAVALLLAALLAAFTPAFQQNDDVVMAMIASGRGVAARADAHLVFMNVLAGELLRRAYAWAPAWPWYGSLLVAVAALAQVALLHARRRPLAYLAWFAAVGATFVVRLQFTSVGGLAAGTGLALWIGRARDAVRDGTPARRGEARSSRRSCCCSAACCASTPCCSRSWSGCRSLLDRLLRLERRRALRAAGGLGAVLALALALHAVDRAAYARDPGWSDFLELNSWRARIVDYGAGGDGAERRALESRLGWSENDGVALRRWLYPDRSVFPVEKLRALVQAAPAARPGAEEAWARVREAFSYPSFLPLALVLPLLVAAGGTRSGLRILLLTLVPSAAVVAALAVFLRAPEHVGLPALAFVPTALLAASDDGPRPRRVGAGPRARLRGRGRPARPAAAPRRQRRRRGGQPRAARVGGTAPARPALRRVGGRVPLRGRAPARGRVLPLRAAAVLPRLAAALAGRGRRAARARDRRRRARLVRAPGRGAADERNLARGARRVRGASTTVSGSAWPRPRARPRSPCSASSEQAWRRAQGAPRARRDARRASRPSSGARCRTWRSPRS